MPRPPRPPPCRPRRRPSSRSTCRSRRCSRRSLEAGEWRPGEAIPSEIDLAGRFGVSQGTVRKAIDALAADNLVVRRQGKGTFVATHTEEGAVVPLPAHPPQRRRRRAPGEPPDRRPARQGRRRGGAAARPEARRRGRRPAARARVRRRAGGARRDHAAGGAVPGADQGQARRLPGLDVQLLRDAVRRADAAGRRTLQAIAADARAPPILGVAPGEPLLAVERVTFTYGDRPVELRRGLCSTRLPLPQRARLTGPTVARCRAARTRACGRARTRMRRT